MSRQGQGRPRVLSRRWPGSRSGGGGGTERGWRRRREPRSGGSRSGLEAAGRSGRRLVGPGASRVPAVLRRGPRDGRPFPPLQPRAEPDLSVHPRGHPVLVWLGLFRLGTLTRSVPGSWFLRANEPGRNGRCHVVQKRWQWCVPTPTPPPTLTRARAV